MVHFQTDFLKLIKSALTSEKVVIGGSFDWEKAVSVAIRHNVSVLLYYGAYNSDITIPERFKSYLEKKVLNQTIISARQDYELSKIVELFEKNSIEYMPLKGMVINKYYPKTEMRYMCDADILIKEEQYGLIKELFEENRLEFMTESNHEYIWRKNMLNIELHKRLIPSYNRDYYKYYGDGWSLAKPDTGCRYKLGNEDFFIYMIAHLAKHYRDGGIGIKHFVDIWVYRQKETELDENYIREELGKLHLTEFYDNCMQMIKSWFDNENGDAITDFMTEHIFFGGAHGTQDNKAISTALRKKKGAKNCKNIRFKSTIDLLFPNSDRMKKKYPFLNKYPFLIFIMWFVRGVTASVFNFENFKRCFKQLSKVNDDSVNKYEHDLKYVGLEFEGGGDDK